MSDINNFHHAFNKQKEKIAKIFPFSFFIYYRDIFSNNIFKKMNECEQYRTSIEGNSIDSCPHSCREIHLN